MKTQVLDFGYVEKIEHWGSDERIIESARMSTGKGFLGWGHRASCGECGEEFSKDQPLVIGEDALCNACHVEAEVAPPKIGDEKLLRFLYENHHDTPFEMAGLTFEVQAPIFVFREWHRHRIPFGYNEMSARYSPLPDVNYIPTVERLMMNAGTSNKQAGTVSGAHVLTEWAAQDFRKDLQDIYEDAEQLYQKALNRGVPKELARIHLPVGRYSRMRATGNLRGWLAFLTLREAPAAQFEIRQFAHAVSSIIAETFPRTHALYVERRDR